MNKTWFIVNDHSFYISKICKFGISYISSVALDILSFNKSTIEILNLDKKRNEKKINFSFSKNSLVYQPFKVNNFKSIVNNVLQRKKYTNYLIKNFRRNYYSENNKKTIKLINKIYYEHCNNMR